MPLDRVLGQDPAIQTLRRALEMGRVHHAYRFEGPDGVGKEAAAFALAQALVCEREGALGCGECRACIRAVTLAEGPPEVPQHPDVVLVERGLYPAKSLGLKSTEVTGISVQQIRNVVLPRIGFPPHEGRALVFIVREAHQLTVQAANALLKTLEEPPPRTYFILITSRPTLLSDTIKSRSLAVRFGPLPTEIVADILTVQGVSPAAALRAEGSVSRAMALSSPELVEAREDFVRRVDEARTAGDFAPALDLAQGSNDREGLLGSLHHLAHALAARSRELVEADASSAAREAVRYGVVMEAISSVHANAAAPLTLEAMMVQLRRT